MTLVKSLEQNGDSVFLFLNPNGVKVRVTDGY